MAGFLARDETGAGIMPGMGSWPRRVYVLQGVGWSFMVRKVGTV